MGTAMNGMELLSAIKVNFPGAQRFLMSGYAAAELESQLNSPLDVVCLTKPFDIKALSNAINSLRGKPATGP
jgi:DNA-binding NtrC family response regulator